GVPPAGGAPAGRAAAGGAAGQNRPGAPPYAAGDRAETVVPPRNAGPGAPAGPGWYPPGYGPAAGAVPGAQGMAPPGARPAAGPPGAGYRYPPPPAPGAAAGYRYPGQGAAPGMPARHRRRLAPPSQAKARGRAGRRRHG